MQYISNYLYLIALTSGFGKKLIFFSYSAPKIFKIVPDIRPPSSIITALCDLIDSRADRRPIPKRRSHPQNWHEILVSIHWWKISFHKEKIHKLRLRDTFLFFFLLFLKKHIYCIWIYTVNIPNSKIHKRGYYSYLMVTGSWCIVMVQVPEDWFWGKRNWPKICWRQLEQCLPFAKWLP